MSRFAPVASCAVPLLLAASVASCGDDNPVAVDAGVDANTDAAMDGCEGDGCGEVDCNREPTAGGCPTCDDDPSLPFCERCEDYPILASCPFEEPAFPGLTADIEVLRDSSGIPHIYAATDADAMFGAGYMMAQDRLFQMDLTRRLALGRQAEVLGERKLDDDLLVRTVGIEALGRANTIALARDNPALLALAVAWTAGVNRRIDEVLAGTAPMPAGFGPTELNYMPERWSVVDGFAVGKLVLFNNANLIEFEIFASVLSQYFPSFFEDSAIFKPLEEAWTLPEGERPPLTSTMTRSASLRRPPRTLPADAKARLRRFIERMRTFRPGASNNWAVDGRHTENGRPLLAGDPHQPLRSPSRFYAQHVNSAQAGGTLDVAGFSFVGAPSVQLGHNARVAWTATTNYPDTMDLVQVRRVGNSVEAGGRGWPIEAREEVFEIRDAATETRTIERIPGLGAILPEGLSPLPIGDGRPILFRWTGLSVTNEYDTFHGINVASDAAAVDASVADFAIGSFNFVVADANGILYRSGMDVPDRGSLAGKPLPYLLMDGDVDGAIFGDARLPPERLIASRGMTRGFLNTSNNDPFGFTADGEFTQDPWYFGIFYDPGTRAKRVEDELVRLTTRGSVTVDDMQALQLDVRSRFADRLLPLLFAAWDAAATTPALMTYRDDAELEALVTALQAWDRQMVRASSDAVVFEALLNFSTRAVLSDDLGLVFDALLNASTVTVHKWAILALEDQLGPASGLVQEGTPQILLEALSAARDFVRDRYGAVTGTPPPYRWDMLHGTLFRADYRGPYDGEYVPTDGADGTVNVSDANFFDEEDIVERLESTGGAIYRAVYSFDEDGTPRAVANFARGNVGEPDSPFWADRLSEWTEGTYQPFLFRRTEIEADVAETLTIPQ
ncbi:MAG: penicillin acylase family protein [Myxococcota bacterium]